MANIKSAKKRIKAIDKKTARNKRVKDHVKGNSSRQFDDTGYIGRRECSSRESTLAEEACKAAAKGSINKLLPSRKVSV